MYILRVGILSLSFVALAATAQEKARVYKWVDENGVVHFGDSVPAEYAEVPKQVLNDRGITVDTLSGKKTPEELEAERKAAEEKMKVELQRRADQALLATYLNVEEILMHRDRRIELFQAQARVTELYLRNLERRLAKLEQDAARFSPYSDEPDAPMIDPDLVADIEETKDTIARHENNLLKYQKDEQQIIARFEGDISRFKVLKGLN